VHLTDEKAEAQRSIISKGTQLGREAAGFTVCYSFFQCLLILETSTSAADSSNGME
jgi:hypothetical protein